MLNADKTEVVGRYTISVDADINPFPLLQLLKGTDKENISAILKQLGYLSVVVNEVEVASGDLVKNIITIHSNFADGLALVQIYGEKIILGQLSLGGVYDFDALIDVIGSLTATAATDGGIDIGGLIETLLGYCDFSNLAENGFTFRISKLPEILTPLLGDLAGTLGGVLSGFWKNAEYINIKLKTPEYGVVNDENKVTDISKLSAYNSTGSDALVSEVTDITIDDILSESDVAPGFNSTFKMKGKPFGSSDEVEFDGYIIGHSKIDMTVSGEQEVTFYVAPANDGAQLVNTIAGFVTLPDGIPFFGVQAVTKSVKVIAFDEDATIKLYSSKNKEAFTQLTIDIGTAVSGTKDLTDYIIGEGSNLSFSTPYVVYNAVINSKEYTFKTLLKDWKYQLLDSTGQDVTELYMTEEGKTMLQVRKISFLDSIPVGKYILRSSYGDYICDIEITITNSKLN